ncbi:MAG: hypothetical protein U0U70_08055 [Chitinophagaceae bacterium]
MPLDIPFILWQYTNNPVGGPMLYYMNNEIEKAMSQPKTLPRYSGLARKAIQYYLGDIYNPETFPIELEYRFRFYIQGFIELKVLEKQPYDWPVIDNFFRFVLNYEGFSHIPFNDDIINKGYNGVMRGELPKHHA